MATATKQYLLVLLLAVVVLLTTSSLAEDHHKTPILEDGGKPYQEAKPDPKPKPPTGTKGDQIDYKKPISGQHSLAEYADHQDSRKSPYRSGRLPGPPIRETPGHPYKSVPPNRGGHHSSERTPGHLPGRRRGRPYEPRPPYGHPSRRPCKSIYHCWRRHPPSHSK